MDMAVTLDPAPKTVAIMVRDDPFGNGVANGVKAHAEEIGLEVVYFEKFPKDVTDVSSMLSAIKNLNPDIMIASTLYQDAVLITKQAKDLQVCPKMHLLLRGCVHPGLPQGTWALMPTTSSAPSGGCRTWAGRVK